MNPQRNLRFRHVGLLATALLAASLVHLPLPAAAQMAPQPEPVVPDNERLVVLIRSSLLALADAVQTGNYTVLRDRAAPSFHAANSAARLAQIFEDLERQNVDLAAVAAIAPDIASAPYIDANRLLHVAGYFPSFPTRIDFDLIFEDVDGRWRLFGISVQPRPADSAALRMPQFVPPTVALRVATPKPTVLGAIELRPGSW